MKTSKKVSRKKEDSLKKKIFDRIRFLRTVIRFVMSIVNKCGEVTNCTSCNSCSAYNYNLGGFSFRVTARRGDKDKNHVLIWYLHWPVAVLSVNWGASSAVDKCNVWLFNHSKEWQESILNLIKSHKGITKKCRNQEKMKKESLNEKARRLKI